VDPIGPANSLFQVPINLWSLHLGCLSLMFFFPVDLGPAVYASSIIPSGSRYVSSLNRHAARVVHRFHRATLGATTTLAGPYGINGVNAYHADAKRDGHKQY
jgi:hypothetical protein